MKTTCALALALVATGVCGCRTTDHEAPPVMQPTIEQLEGTWGANGLPGWSPGTYSGVRLEIGDSYSTMQTNCTSFDLYGAFLLFDGTFDLSGIAHLPGGPGVTTEARFQGELVDQVLFMTVTFPSYPTTPADFELHEGEPGDLGTCLIQ